MASSYHIKTDVYPSLVPSMDADNRDPMGLNKHLRLDFHNVIAEPDASAYNFELLHNASHQVYHYTKIFIYRFLAVIVGLPLMLFWGLFFGVYTFLMIWLAVPARRLMQSIIAEAGLYIQTICDAIIGPMHHSMGQIFSSMRISLFSEQVHSAKQIQV